MSRFEDYLDEEEINEFVFTPESSKGLDALGALIGLGHVEVHLIFLGMVILSFFAPSIYQSLKWKWRDFLDGLKYKKIGKEAEQELDSFKEEVMKRIESLPKGKKRFAKSMLNKVDKDMDKKQLGRLVKTIKNYVDKGVVSSDDI